MNLVQRVQDILLRPKATWPQIEREPASVGSLYTEYLVVLAAISSICSFIGLSIVGVGMMGVQIRMPFVSGLVNMVVGFVLTLGAVYVLALIADALAPSFQGRRDPLAALKLVAYASTAGLLGGVFGILPALAPLGLLAALYSAYLLYLGLPVMMKCPPEKSLAYTAVLIVCGIVLGVVVGTVASLLMPGPRMGIAGAPAPGGNVTLNLPGGEVKIDTAKLEEAARRMEEAGRRAQQAQAAASDPAAAASAAGQAMGDVLAALGGGAAGSAIAPATLKGLLPATLGGLPQVSVETQGGQVAGFAGSAARARYEQGEQRIELSITDLGGVAGIAAAAFAAATVERETADRVERSYRQGARGIKEEAAKDGSHAEMTVLLANGVAVEARGERTDLAGLKRALEGLGLDRIEALKRPEKS
ncbi:Yip1 family protein [Piscinibacter sakaiensis]|uniref:DUF1282 protein n=1 Tax=Piscinibacter sakaiensis TaxID=1547922 RepID=A0A0K8P4Z8_PISS1|nr:Yip1 family protein [Piscinibacter sakaiensis]GAP37778.1 DUF1282 protein [Piscinibacter sakaiensis]